MFDKITTVLPPHSTDFERALEQASLWVVENSAIPRIWDTQLCPEDLLPWLAWSLSVDHWNPEWGVDQKRDAVKRSIYIHRKKGTVGAVKSAVAGFGYASEIAEWFEYGGETHTFKIKIEGDGTLDLNNDFITQFVAVIDAVKPARSHYDMNFRYTEIGTVYAGGYTRVQIVANAPAKLFSVPILTASAGPRLGLETHIQADAGARP